MQDSAAQPPAHPSTARSEHLPEPSGGYLGTPRGQIVLALVFWIVAGATAAAALLLMRQAEFATPTRRIIAQYAAFGVSTVFILLSIVMLLVGSVRWAILGPKAPAGEHLGTAELRRDLALISDRLLLSETAKKVAFRREDVALLHRTIRQDIAEHDFNAAMVLVEALGSFYGQLPEAEAFRDEIRKLRAADQEAQVEAGVLEMDRILARQDFAGARREADRLIRLYPDAHGTDGLHEWVDRAKAQYKVDLEAEFIQAKDRGEIDKALDLMTRLDKMLTPTEAEPFREAAREVFAWRVLLPGPARIDAEWIAYRRLAAGGLSPEPLWRTHDASACAHVAGVRVSRRLVRRRGLVWRYLDETLTLAAAAHRRGVTHLDLNLGNIIDGRVGAGRRPRHADAGTLKLIDFEYGPPDGMSSATQRQLDVLTLLDEFARKRRGGRRLARDPGRFSAAVERGVPAAVRASDSGLRLDRFRHLSRSPRLHACVVRAFPRLRAV